MRKKNLQNALNYLYICDSVCQKWTWYATYVYSAVHYDAVK